MNKQLMSGLGTVTGAWMAGQIGLKPVPAIPYDLQMAKAFLAKTPYGPGGQTLTMQLQIPNRDGWPQMLALGQAVQGYWKAIGVDTNIINRDYGTMRAQFAAHTLPSPAALMYNQPGVVAWLPNTNLYMSCAGVLSVACDQQLESSLADWAQKSDMTGYQSAAASTQRYILDNFYVVPILEAPGYYVGNAQIRPDYSPGVSFLGINTRAMVASNYNY
jgi:ABC-type transport system substrate-binding protein